MTKNHLLRLYRTKLNHITLTYASMVLWSYPDIPLVYKELYARLKPQLSNRPDVLIDATPMIDDAVALRIAAEELYDSAHRAAVKELFPLTKLYCQRTGQLDSLKRQAWFEFWRIIRNCWSHNMTFNFNRHERSVLPISWSGVTLDISMNGKPLTYGQRSREKLRELLEQAQEFVRNELA